MKNLTQAQTFDARYLIAGLLVVAAPCIPLLNLTSNFAVDWPNQVWLINYVASFLACHGTFPLVINTTQLIGMPYPIFYGYLFFPLFGLLSIFWNGDITVRLMVVCVYAAQFALLCKLCTDSGKSKFFSLCLATFVTWSIYPMTNLYNRGAIPEFFATGSLTCACLLWLLALRAKRVSDRFILCNLFVWFYILAAGSHPITALYGACFLVLFLASSLWIAKLDPRKFLLPLLLPAILGTISLLPWAMVTTQYSPKMQIRASFDRVGYFSRSLDSIYTRLSPIPINTRSYRNRLRDDHVGPRYLDMQICFPVLVGFLICLVSVIKRRRDISKRLLASVLAFGGLATLMIWSSTTIHSMDVVGPLLRTIQFAYRSITYINLSLLAAVLFVVLYDRPDNDTSKAIEKQTVLVSLLVVSLIALVIKLSHAELAAKEAHLAFLRTPTLSVGLAEMPPSFYGWGAYAVTDAFPMLSPDDLHASTTVAFKPDANDFGGVQPLDLKKGIYKTNIQAFPWGHLFSGNQELPRYMVHELPSDHKTGLKAQADGPVTYQFIPDPKWLAADVLALIVFFGWTIVTFLLLLFRRKPATAQLVQGISPAQVESST